MADCFIHANRYSRFTPLRMATDHIAAPSILPDSAPPWALSPTHASVGSPLCSTGNDSAWCHRPSSVTAAILLSTSLITLIFIISVLIWAMKKAIGRASDGGSSTPSSIERGLESDDSKEESILVDAMGDARLVLLPGDDTPRIVAIPSYLPLTIVIETSSSFTAAADPKK
ncbi:hypothetical protein KP509_31G057800 [Ceratopteris richardii]|uniref:Uncharacterized protein n=1 Tax=Ceratopteris richardii TaxID=49495 RepID=A0A8T2QZN4_CERRI|nr:hypothetical protein KP509_31G057800 [Ceratopteris richardii]